MEKVILREVNESDIDFLFQLLKNRNPKANISHKTLPSFEDHQKFVMSKPYKNWYVILYENDRIGSIYLSKQDEIGIFLENHNHGKGIGSQALEILINKNPQSRYLANINPLNLESEKFFKKHDFKLIQHTFELLKK